MATAIVQGWFATKKSKVLAWLRALRAVRFIFEEDKHAKLVLAFTQSLPALLALRTLAHALVHHSPENKRVNHRCVRVFACVFAGHLPITHRCQTTFKLLPSVLSLLATFQSVVEATMASKPSAASWFRQVRGVCVCPGWGGCGDVSPVQEETTRQYGVLLQVQSCVYQIFKAYPAEVKEAIPSLAKERALHLDTLLRATDQTQQAIVPSRYMLGL